MPQALKTLCLIHFWGWKNSLFPLLAIWGNKNWPPSMKVKKMETSLNKRGLKGYKLSSLSAPGTENPLCHPLLGLEEFPFPIIGPLGYLELASQYESETFENLRKQNGLNGLQKVQFECPWH